MNTPFDPSSPPLPSWPACTNVKKLFSSTALCETTLSIPNADTLCEGLAKERSCAVRSTSAAVVLTRDHPRVNILHAVLASVLPIFENRCSGSLAKLVPWPLSNSLNVDEAARGQRNSRPPWNASSTELPNCGAHGHAWSGSQWRHGTAFM
jgi:hypothetical protein